MTTQTEKIQSGIAESHRRTLDRLLREVREWARQEGLRRQLRHERRRLLEADDALLADLGISRHEAEAEARRTDIPAERQALLDGGRQP